MAEWWEDSEAVEATGSDWWDEGELVQDTTSNKPPPTPDEVPWYDKAVGGLEAGAAIASSMAAEPISGLAGIAGAVLPGEQGQGADWAQGTQEALSYAPGGEEGQEYLQNIGEAVAPVGEAIQSMEGGMGEATLEATGSPMLAAAAHSVPTLLMEAIGLGSLRRGSQAAKAARRATDEDLSVSGLMDELEPEARNIEEITQDIVKNKSGRLVEDVRADIDLMNRAEELGIELNPSHYSTNEAYRRVEQAIKEQPDSQLFKREAKAMQDISRAGDELITDLDGDLDRSLLQADLKERIDYTVGRLENQADTAYTEIDANIPKATPVKPRTSQRYIDARVEELGGDISLLTTPEMKMYKMFTRDKAPTYNALDTLRKEIGDGYKMKGPFRDTATSDLNQVYSVLIKDQKNAAKAMNMGREFDAAQNLIQKRKNVEARAEIMFGRQMKTSFLPKLASAASTLTKGDTRQFKQLMEALPADMRKRAAATMLNDLFKQGGSGQGIGDAFASTYGKLERNKGAMNELKKYIPEPQWRRFESIGKISQGISRARRFENKSGSGRVVMQGLEDGTLVNRIIERGGTGAANVMGWKLGGHFGAAAADRAGKAVKRLVSRDKAADELLASPAFRKAIDLGMENKITQADTLLKRSAAWQKWRTFLGEGNAAQLRAMGPISWLTQQEGGEGVQ